jgi:hypothetical protein
MATGGIFTLITNDGKQDRMLMATALLNKRLLEIERMRSRNPNIKDPTPTLVDIERTHLLFMNAHFKPFAAIGYEYNKTSVQSGTARLGSQIQFSIPQFGDFFHDMVLHLQLSAVTALNANYWTTPLTSPAVGQELLSYVNYVGQALVQDVQFQVNGNPLDEYDSEVMNFHQKFFITPNKTIGWNRNVGQEIPSIGYSEVTSSSLAGSYNFRGALVRQQMTFLDGAQTPQVTQPVLDLWMPLLFWCNKDPRLAIPSVSIPYGQRYINVLLAPAANILQHQHAYNPAADSPGNFPPPVPDVLIADLYINNIFVNPEIHDIFIKRIGFSLIRVHRRQVIRDNKATDQLLMNQLKWPIETIYCGFRPISNIDTTSSALLYSWNIYSEVTPVTVNTLGLTNGYTFAAALPATNITADQYTANFVSFTGLGLDFAASLGAPVTGATVISVNQLNYVLQSHAYPPLIGTFVSVLIPTAAEIDAALPSAFAQSTYYSYTPTLTAITIEAHGVPLYNAIPAVFFNQYVPYNYGGSHIQTPYDVGAYMITFNLYPGSYQPSGHVNISRAREFYFNYVSATVGSTVPSADLSIVAVAINFLLISDGSAVLRYST